MPRPKKPKKVESISKLIDCLKNDIKEELVWFRGHADCKWELLPHLARDKKWLDAECDLIAKFKQNSALLLSPLPKEDWEWLTIMQHHGVPTRLLDWTESPLTALYFAVEEKAYSNVDGALWVLYPTHLNKLGSIEPDYENYIPTFEDDSLTPYTPKVISAETTSRMNPIAVIGPRNTERMQAQLGVFTVIHRVPTPIEKVGDGKHVIKYIIPKEKKKHLLEELSFLKIGKFQLFPELQSMGDILKENLKKG